MCLEGDRRSDTTGTFGPYGDEASLAGNPESDSVLGLTHKDNKFNFTVMSAG